MCTRYVKLILEWAGKKAVYCIFALADGWYLHHHYGCCCCRAFALVLSEKANSKSCEWLNEHAKHFHTFLSEKKKQRINPMAAFELQNHLTCSTNFAVQQHQKNTYSHTHWIFKKEEEAMEQENACRWQNIKISWHWIDQRSVNMHAHTAPNR